MNTVLPDIDVIIPFHRVNTELISAIQSVEKSSDIDVRLILVNDTQGTGFLKTYGQKIETEEVFTKSRGYLSALETGIKASNRSYIGFLDSDDLTKSDRFRIQINALNQSGSDISTGRLVPITTNGLLVKKRPLLGKIPETLTEREKLILGSHGADSTIVAKGDFLRENWVNHGKFPAEFADYAWMIGLPSETSIVHCVNALYYYRQHPNQMSRKRNISKNWGEIAPHILKNFDNNFSTLELLELKPSDQNVLAALIFPSLLTKLSSTEKKRLLEICDQVMRSLYMRFENPREIRTWKQTLARRALIGTRTIHPKNAFAALSIGVDICLNRINGIQARKNS